MKLVEQPDHEGFVRANGIEHWYRLAGAEHATTPLVVVHGGPGGNVYTFERAVGPHLERFATVVYYDQRGSGRSASPASADDYSLPLLVADLEDLRGALGIDRMALLGFSFGAELALEYALAHPDRVDRLVLQCPTPLVADLDRIAGVQLYGLDAVARGEVKQRVREVLAMPGTPQEQFERVWEVVDTETVDRFLFRDQEAAAWNRDSWEESELVHTGDMFRALLKRRATGDVGSPLLDRVDAITCPALLLVGLYDRNVGVDFVRDIAERLPRAELVIFERSAHFPDIEEPERYAEAVRLFLTES